MKREITVSAPGKVHFLGEHAVVYGKPALLAAIDRRCKVSFFPRNDTKVEIIARNLNKTVILTEKDVLRIAKNAQAKWEGYIQKTDISLLKSITKNRLNYPIIAIGETLKYYKKDLPSGFKLSIDSDIPMGAGLGSSAAVAVTVVAAITQFLDESFNREIINDIAYLVEQKMHGMPSGGDNATVCYGGLVWFRKESEEFKIIQPVPFAVPKKMAKNFLIIDTGQPKESTGELVGQVSNLYKEKPKVVELFLNDQEKLTRELLSIIKNLQEDELIRVIKEGERNLESIGVVSKFGKSIMRDIEKVGGAAKICGAGGKTKEVGVILAYHQSKAKLKEIAETYNFSSYDVSLSADGVK